MSEQTLLGFDFGVRRIGVAVGQTITASARPLTTLNCPQRGVPDWAALDRLLREWQPQALVVGRPTHADGTDNSTTVASDAFARALGDRYRLSVHRVDERLSSHEAESRLAQQGARARQKQGAIDMMAACIILETWLADPAA